MNMRGLGFLATMAMLTDTIPVMFEILECITTICPPIKVENPEETFICFGLKKVVWVNGE